MARRKAPRKEEFTTLPNACKHAFDWRGKWKEWFGNDNPLVLEIGCGKGELSIGMAIANPSLNLTGIDLKSDRLWVGAKRSIELGLKNICFHRLDVNQLTQAYGPGEAEGIWITFPDPYPKKKNAPKRLTHRNFLAQYTQVIRPGGWIRFKTDNTDLFDWTLWHLEKLGQPLLKMTHDLHHSEFLNAETGIITSYEKRFMSEGKPVHFLEFSPLPEYRIWKQEEEDAYEGYPKYDQ